MTTTARDPNPMANAPVLPGLSSNAKNRVLIILVLAVLALIGWYGCGFVSAFRAISAATKCVANMRAITTACTLYGSANGGVLPSRLDDLLKPNPGLQLQLSQITCPVGGHRYVYVAGLRTASDPRAILVYDPSICFNRNHQITRSVGFVDGHAARSSEQEFEIAMKLTDQVVAAEAALRVTTRPQSGR